MKKTTLVVIVGFLWVMSIAALPAGAYTIDIDLNDFFLEGVGSIASDGSSAFLEEDSEFGYTLLTNDPLSVDPGIGVPAGALSLSFSYDFSEAPDNDTEFYVRLFDGKTGDFLLDFLRNSSDIGSVAFDLTGLDWPAQNLLGLEFTLAEYGLDQEGNFMTGSTVTIRNLQVAGTDQVVIPEPGTMILLGAGLIALGFLQRKQRQ